MTVWIEPVKMVIISSLVWLALSVIVVLLAGTSERSFVLFTPAPKSCIRPSPFAAVHLREGPVLVGVSAIHVLWEQMNLLWLARVLSAMAL